jgi:hypothetical protein
MTSLNLSDERYLAALIRIRGLVEGGVAMELYDEFADEACTWGLCSRKVEAWPDDFDHLWPDQFRDQGRVAPLYKEDHQRCPLDKRMTGEEAESMNGCFYTCRVYGSKGVLKKSREQVLELYDQAIERIRKRMEVASGDQEMDS